MKRIIFILTLAATFSCAKSEKSGDDSNVNAESPFNENGAWSLNDGKKECAKGAILEFVKDHDKAGKFGNLKVDEVSWYVSQDGGYYYFVASDPTNKDHFYGYADHIKFEVDITRAANGSERYRNNTCKVTLDMTTMFGRAFRLHDWFTKKELLGVDGTDTLAGAGSIHQ